MTELKIEAGKFYRTRSGKKARVYCVNADDTKYPVHGAIKCDVSWDEWCLHRWAADGGDDLTIDDGLFDIVSEWREEPQVDWSKYPEFVLSIAMNGDLTWFAHYDRDPEIHEGNRRTDGYGFWGQSDWKDQCFRIPEAYAPKFEGEWKDSLVRRPQ